MDNEGKLIRDYLEKNSDFGKGNKTEDCFSEQVLCDYFTGALDKEETCAVEYHLAGCGFCLSQLNVLFQAQQKDKQDSLAPAPQELIDKTKYVLGVFDEKKGGKTGGTKKIKKLLFLLGAVAFYVLSFIIPKYFLQFLVGTLILGIRWAFESEGGRTLIMVLDSWRHHSRDKDEEISHRLKNHL